MQKRLAGSIVILLLLASVCSAQVPRSNGFQTFAASDSSTTFTNINIVGQDVTGNPAHLSLRGSDSDGSITYYLWVDNGGDLLIASHVTMATFSSFPTGDWRTLKDSHTGISTVGEQT